MTYTHLHSNKSDFAWRYIPTTFSTADELDYAIRSALNTIRDEYIYNLNAIRLATNLYQLAREIQLISEALEG